MDKPIKVVQDTKYPTMFRLQWADGVLSEDFYNKTRAHDILRNYDNYVKNMELYGNTRARKQIECPEHD